MKNKIVVSTKKTLNSLKQTFPIILGTIILIALFQILIPSSFYQKIFTGSFWDIVLGSAISSVAAGNPITSYIIGGELLKNGITLIAVTAFIISWVTVGVIQFPAESLMLGKKFALVRNILAFISAIIIALITGLIFNYFNV